MRRSFTKEMAVKGGTGDAQYHHTDKPIRGTHSYARFIAINTKDTPE